MGSDYLFIADFKFFKGWKAHRISSTDFLRNIQKQRLKVVKTFFAAQLNLVEITKNFGYSPRFWGIPT